MVDFFSMGLWATLLPGGLAEELDALSEEDVVALRQCSLTPPPHYIRWLGSPCSLSPHLNFTDFAA